MLNKSFEPMQLIIQHVAPFAYSTLVVTSLQIETVCSGSSWIFLSSILAQIALRLRSSPNEDLSILTRLDIEKNRHKSFQRAALEF